MLSLANKKQLRFEITLGDGTFGNADTIILKGYRASASITLAGGQYYGTLRAQIYGMKQSDMDAITSYSIRVGLFKPNIVRVYAIDGPRETMVFVGNIITAWADYQSMPDVYLDMQAQAANSELLKSVPPRSFKGAVDVAGAMEQIAASMQWGFKNWGVDTVLQGVYLPNTGMAQAQKLADDAGINLWTDNRTLTIAPKGVARGDVVPLISAKTGMVGYPTYDGVTVICRTLFNPSIQQGGLVQIESDVQRATGRWVVLSMDVALESERPGGQWFTVFRAVNPKLYGYRI